MEEAKKELKIEGIEEIREKAVGNANLKVRDYVDVARELTGLIRENCITGLQLFFSIWEENLKVINRQAEEWVRIQEASAKLMVEPFVGFPTEAVNFWGSNSKFINGHVGKMVAFQKDYSQAVTNTSDKFMKEAIGFMKNSIDNIIWSLNEYIGLNRG